MIFALVGGLLTIAAQTSTVTFATDVEPIIRAQCAGCHRPQGDAPVSLETLDEVRRRASTIVSVTRSRYMPPWKPVQGFGDFQHARRLTDRQIATIERWVNSGMSDTSATVRQNDPTPREWPLGQPDVVIDLPAYTLKADGGDEFRNFVIPVPTTTSRFVRGLQFRPNSRAVHHANIRIDTTPASRSLDAADPSPGYEGTILHSADFPDGHFLGWTPGQLAPVASDDTAWTLPPGSDLVVQLHMRPTGAVESIAPQIGIYFGDRAAPSPPTMIRLGRQDFDIPAGATTHRVEDSFTLPVDADALAIQAHAHYRARSVDAWATLPNGSRVPLLRIDDWDAAWQDRYLYRQAVTLPAGTRLTTVYVFDNSTGNPRNPDRVPARSRWGWRSSDEMGDVWIQVRTRSDSDRARLRRDVTRHMLTQDAIGTELLLEREPDHLALRNDAAQIYLSLGKPSQAFLHFGEVTRRQFDSASAWFNEGTALEAMGDARNAKSRYQQALKRDPRYSPALNNLGALQLRDGLIAEARDAFAHAIESDPVNADAQANLGLVLLATRQPDAALARIARALDLKPALLAGMMPHAWLLAANADADSRRPAEALALAERIAKISADRAAALDLLAACQAATGDFDRAVRTAGAAWSAAPASSTALREAIRDRIGLYKAKRPFVLNP